MMTLLNEVKKMVTPYLRDEMMEEGVNEFTIEEGNVAVDIKCEHTFESNPKWQYCYAAIVPKQILVYVGDEDGNYSEPQDMTREFDAYEYKFLN